MNIIHILPTHPEPAWQRMAQPPPNGTTQPVEIEEEARFQPRTDNSCGKNKKKVSLDFEQGKTQW